MRAGGRLVLVHGERGAGALCEQVARWEIPRAPVLGDSAYGDNSDFRARLHEYVLAVDPELGVFGPETTFAVPERKGGPGRSKDRHVERIEAQVERFAPGFRDRILARHVLGPGDLDARNRSLGSGEVGGGS